ncbi:MAG: response regulator [Dehalococcoidia bacterium]
MLQQRQIEPEQGAMTVVRGHDLVERILVVEDDREIATMMRELLEEDGYLVEVVYSLSEAADEVRREQYSLVVRDTMAQTADGFRQNIDPLLDLAVRPPVVITSAHGIADEDVEVRGYDGLIRKPFDIEEFSRQIAAHLRSARAIR